MKQVKRILIGLGGGLVFAIGIAMILLPGPAFLVIPAGLAILAIEFAWARRWSRSLRAVMPRSSAGESKPRRITMESFRRCTEFLIRQVRRTLARQRNSPEYSVVSGPGNRGDAFLVSHCGSPARPAVSIKR